MIPINYYKYKETPIWINNSIPNVIQERHNTKIWIYAKIIIISWELEYTVYNQDNSIKSVEILNPSIIWIIKPQEWHSIKPVWEVKLFVEFYKENSKVFTKKETVFKLKYNKSPHREVQELVNILKENNNNLIALDIGCGLWRNSIFMADNWFQLTSIDRNIDWLKEISEVANNNNLNINTLEVNLNSYYIKEKYDCIFSTVVLQFLEKQSAINIIKSMQIATNAWWYNLIIVPIDANDHLCPIRFPWLFKQWEILNFYNTWEVIEYNEMLWTFHRKDKFWNRIISRFATIIAKKKS